jgi:hypothetical protein
LIFSYELFSHAIADLDGDLDFDLVVANAFTDDVSDFIGPGTNEVRLLLPMIQTSGPANVRTQLDEVLFNFE